MNKRPIILLDIMDTLVTEPFFTEMPAFFQMTLDELLAAKHPTGWIEFEKGLIGEDDYLAKFFQDGRRVDGDGLRKCLLDSYRWLDGMEELTRQLHETGYELHALSNYPVWYQLIEEQLRLSRYLKWTFVSCLIGVRKPDPQIYSLVTNTLSVQPQDCLFIDDRQVNIDAAISAGFDAILKRDVVNVREELSRRKIFVN